MRTQCRPHWPHVFIDKISAQAQVAFKHLNQSIYNCRLKTSCNTNNRSLSTEQEKDRWTQAETLHMIFLTKKKKSLDLYMYHQHKTWFNFVVLFKFMVCNHGTYLCRSNMVLSTLFGPSFQQDVNATYGSVLQRGHDIYFNCSFLNKYFAYI